MTPADQRVTELVDKWLKSIELHLAYTNLTDEAYWQVQPWVRHQRPARWILDLAHTRAKEVRRQLAVRVASGDSSFSETLELMAFLANLVGVQSIERFIPLAEPERENREVLGSTHSTLQPLNSTSTQTRALIEPTREMRIPPSQAQAAAPVAAATPPRTQTVTVPTLTVPVLGMPPPTVAPARAPAPAPPRVPVEPPPRRFEPVVRVEPPVRIAAPVRVEPPPRPAAPAPRRFEPAVRIEPPPRVVEPPPRYIEPPPRPVEAPARASRIEVAENESLIPDAAAPRTAPPRQPAAARAAPAPPPPRAAGKREGRSGASKAPKPPPPGSIDGQVLADAVRLIKWGRAWHELAEAIARIADRPGVVEVRKILRTHKIEIERQSAE